MFCFVLPRRLNEEAAGTGDRIPFANATNSTADISNALALDMTYRDIYYGQRNKVRCCRSSCGRGAPSPRHSPHHTGCETALLAAR